MLLATRPHQHGMSLVEISVVLLVLTALAGVVAPYVGNKTAAAMCQTTDATLQAVKTAIMGNGNGAGFYGDTLGYYPKATKSTNADYALSYLLTAPTDGSWGNMAQYNPKTALGWRGPYLQTGGVLSAEATLTLDNSFDAYDAATNPNGKAHINHRVTTMPQIFDGWHHPIILQIPNTCSYATTPAGCARLVSAGPGDGRDAIIDTPLNDDSASTRNDDRVLYLAIPDPLPSGNAACAETL